jgi:hypothetical protein
MTLAGLKGISRSYSELSRQFRMVSTSDSNKRFRSLSFTFDVEFITISDGTLQKYSD